MLGLRRYHHVTFDLWQGPADAFVADRQLEQTADHAAALQQACEAEESKLRHLAWCLNPDQTSAFPELLLTLKESIDSGALRHNIKRITFIAPSSTVYDIARHHLRQTLPEDEPTPTG